MNNMEQQIQTIRESCIKANPSILVRAQIIIHGIRHDCNDRHTIKNAFSGLDEDIEQQINAAWTKIIGNPIRLADVLLAIGNQKNVFNDTVYFIDYSGQMAIWEQKDAIPYFVSVTWNLPQDDLRSQSKETIEFISNLLSG